MDKNTKIYQGLWSKRTPSCFQKLWATQ